MKQLFLCLISFGFIISCSNNPANQKDTTKESPATNNPGTSPNTSKEPLCYRYIGNRDTVYLQLSEVYGTMTGMMIVKNYQKDQNVGTLQGQMTGDVLIADYSFKSEGTMSVRQVAFKKKGNDYVEGFGDVNEVNGKMVFKDASSLIYDASRIFMNVPCKK